MSAVTGSYTYEMDASYAADFSRDREPMKTRSRHPEYRRKGSAPTRVSGMHCRRNKRWTWGSGRGARMSNVRAFAGCLAVALAALATNSFAATFDWVAIRNAGNPNNVVSGTNFGGAVANEFSISKTETTNAQYVQFLNSVDQNGTNPFGIASGTGGAFAGYAFNSGASVGSKYSVKPGAPSGAPAGTSFANMPVNNISWFSAARFVNWVAGGQLSGTAGAASMNAGSYTLGSATSGNLIARNVGAQIFLPSLNEWYKSAFYNGTSGTYTQYQTNSNVAPTALSVTTGSTSTNAGNFASVANLTATIPVNVGSYLNTTSAYGLYDMLGNVVELTDTANPSNAAQFRALGGGYGGALASWNAISNPVFQNSTLVNPNYGFRVATATVAPVPEPETITLAAFGIVGLCGANWLKRRRKAAGQAVPLTA